MTAMDTITCCVLGARSHRMPLAYPALAQLFACKISFTSPTEADLLMFGHPDDLIEAAEMLVPLCRANPHKRVIYLSEEPFWDTVGPIPPFQRQQTLNTEFGPLAITCLTHHSSAIFTFERIPYFLLTDTAFSKRYARHFAANRKMNKNDWQAHFARAPLRAAFMAENRLSPKLDVHFDDHGVRGLCTWRTELAIRYRTGPVLRAGKGWSAGSQDRVALPDWHLDKLQRLDRQCVFVSALENTHQPSYVSEKIFDAFALGAVPLYYAAPDHAVHRIVPEGAWLNLYGLSVTQAAAAIDAFDFDDAFYTAYMAAQTQLAALFTTQTWLTQEQARLAQALLAELETVLHDQPRS